MKLDSMQSHDFLSVLSEAEARLSIQLRDVKHGMEVRGEKTNQYFYSLCDKHHLLQAMVEQLKNMDTKDKLLFEIVRHGTV